MRQYYELVADTYDLRSTWEKAVSEAGLDAVRPWYHAPPPLWGRQARELMRVGCSLVSRAAYFQHFPDKVDLSVPAEPRGPSMHTICNQWEVLASRG